MRQKLMNLALSLPKVVNYLLVFSIRMTTLGMSILPWIIPIGFFYHLTRRLERIKWMPRVILEWIRDDRPPETMGFPPTTPEILTEHGYGCESHPVTSEDGYFLVMHRILLPLNAFTSDPRYFDDGASRIFGDGEIVPTASTTSIMREEEMFVPNRGPPVLLLHGALLTSASWVLREKTDECIGLALANAGYDVWLYNRRGNRYSQLHSRYHPESKEFWQFSIDEGARHDLKACIAHILELTGYQTISLVGFSQGTTESFAALSSYPEVERRVNCFVALSPAAKPAESTNIICRLFYQQSPELAFYAMGDGCLARPVIGAMQRLPPRFFAFFFDFLVDFIFGMKHPNISVENKTRMYQHSFSMSSTKQIIHFMQMIATGQTQMYLDAGLHAGYPAIEYPLNGINVPLTIILGTKDSIVDAAHMSRALPVSKAAVIRLPGYEHLDTLWAEDVGQKVIPLIINQLDSYAEWRQTTITDYSGERRKTISE